MSIVSVKNHENGRSKKKEAENRKKWKRWWQSYSERVRTELVFLYV